MSHEKGKRRPQHYTRGFPTGADLLHDPALNKGVAFSVEEREILALSGLLPPQVLNQEAQVERLMANVRKIPDALARYVYLMTWLDLNETVFYRALVEHLEELLPLVYTPTVGRACQEYGHIFQRPRGLFISSANRGRIADLLRNWPYARVRVIVVTDGERILGLGDLGINGMGIPVGKLCLYVACGGVYPSQCLPVTLDVGTENDELRHDPLYLGLKQHRLRGEMYDALLREFFEAVREVFPQAVIQLEDFGNRNAFRLLERYRQDFCVFDDDIQGTAAVTVAGLNNAARITGTALREQKVLLAGAGEAGLGIGELLVSALKGEGVSAAEARAHCWYMDSKGLVVAERSGLDEHKQRFAHAHPPVANLADAVRQLHPTALIGVSGQAGLFDQNVIEAMAEINPRPIIFALSNPTSKAECTAQQAYTWSRGRAVFASGSPFAPVEYEAHHFIPGQGNNAYIFPGVGLGVLMSEARRVSDEMFLAAAAALASQVTPEEREQGLIYPPLNRIREVSAAIAGAVIEVAYAQGLARRPRPHTENLSDYVNAYMYFPDYHSYV